MQRSRRITPTISHRYGQVRSEPSREKTQACPAARAAGGQPSRAARPRSRQTYSREVYTLRQIDALERIWCINCDREHRLMRYWEALGAGVLRRRPSFLKPKLGPRPAIMPHIPR